ncbi:tyrosine-type recombinase/integrase [Mesorhizobium sp. B263B2A]|uniref:tyrosine-type recombinase/integrase n=1 Tax=Mesorhizobium sp. B263B2A TaxID=2876669 RepID=UPI001CD07032|nr:tyrosine-type recombinase/integrase [Mesorhizobium sp. B263B2A]MCA0032696.1 site-specific integrase [Mesorhizobium sp. B263B2A]
MTEGMPRKLPPFVARQRSRHGKVVFYFRKDKGKRTRLPDLNAPDFDAKYLAALAAIEPPRKALAGAGSLAWLITRYKDSGAYAALSAATRRQRDNILKGVVAKAGHHPYKSISRKSIVNGREARASTPAQARNYLDAMRGLFRWALDAEFVAVDPTESVKNPKRQAGDGFIAWSEDDVDAFEARWPAGTKERVWLHVLLYTGLRRGDAVMIGKQHIRDGVATIRTEKSKFKMEVSIPILPVLAKTLATGPTGDLALIVGSNGKPLTKESFGNYFRVACNGAGLKRRSAHGVRKIGATRAAEAGATDKELDALFGWEGGMMSKLYTQKAERKRLSRQASEKIENAQRPPQVSDGPHPEKMVG